MLQQAVVFLLLVLGPTLPARSTSQQNRQYYEVDLPTEDFDEDLDDDDLGQSPWLEFASVQVGNVPGAISSRSHVCYGFSHFIIRYIDGCSGSLHPIIILHTPLAFTAGSSLFATTLTTRSRGC